MEEAGGEEVNANCLRTTLLKRISYKLIHVRKYVYLSYIYQLVRLLASDGKLIF